MGLQVDRNTKGEPIDEPIRMAGGREEGTRQCHLQKMLTGKPLLFSMSDINTRTRLDSVV